MPFRKEMHGVAFFRNPGTTAVFGIRRRGCGFLLGQGHGPEGSKKTTPRHAVATLVDNAERLPKKECPGKQMTAPELPFAIPIPRHAPGVAALP